MVEVEVVCECGSGSQHSGSSDPLVVNQVHVLQLFHMAVGQFSANAYDVGLGDRLLQSYER